jgi:hypothetical protein
MHDGTEVEAFAGMIVIASLFSSVIAISIFLLF